jgi:hypothetical protein
MNYTVYYIAQIILSCIGLFFAYKILECERVDSKWILYSFMVLQVLNLIGQVTGLCIFIFKHDEFMDKRFDKVFDKEFPNSTTKKVVKDNKAAAGIATILTLLIVITVLCFIFNIYFLVKLFQCNTTWFGIYLVANILSVIPSFI